MAVNVVRLANGEAVIDLSGDTVYAAAMLEGITAHGADGEPVVGGIAISRGSTTEVVSPQKGYNIGPCLKMSYNPSERRVFSPDEAMLDLVAPFSEFGDATAEDVAVGKTFTSAAGFKAVGTNPGQVAYTPLAYLESSGEQYIDTGISGGANAAYEIILTPLSAANWEHYIGGYSWAMTPPKLYGANSTLTSSAKNASGDTIEKYASEALNKMITVRFNTDGSSMVTVSGAGIDVIQDFSEIAGTGWGSQSWWIFNCHAEPTLFSKMRLHGFKMWTDGALVRDFAPVQRSFDGVCGLFDTVTGQFFGNIGTGAFTGIALSEYESTATAEYAEALQVLGVSV